MTVHALEPADEPLESDLIADRIVDRLLSHPTFIDALADKLAAALTAAPASEPAAPAIEPSTATAPAGPDSGEETEAVVTELQSWVLCNRPDLVSGDPAVWTSAIVAAATPRRAQAMFVWAFTESCPSPFWRDLTTPIAAPRAGRGAGRHGHFAQLLAEYRAATSEDPDAPAKIDTVVAGVISAVTTLRVQEFSQQPVNARKNALAVLRKHRWDADEIVAIIGWGVRSKQHWRSNVSGVPTAATFTRIRGDWISAGSPVERTISDEQRATIDVLARGWVYHYSKRQNFSDMAVSPATFSHLHDCLTGADGADPVPAETIKSFVRWLCQPDNRHTAFLVSGVDFPSLAQVRRGIISMSTHSDTSVAATNRGASGQVSTSIDVSEV
ncbi:hypothetical protein [Gordonia sihwensis]|uniref:hypothetical protein n=1 Tax=Gordonia sihwensis TaxID=173559 RepID=UPI0005EDBE73|nr:hypothetical protein [Gordonia sihwensis]KJR10295.1 hypothetical protein UG54_01590 [Gordonia sihwensis]